MRSLLLLVLLVSSTACSGVSPAAGADAGAGADADADATPEPADGSVDAPVGTLDGGVDATVPLPSTEGVYFGACLSVLAAGRVDRVLRFYTVVKHTPGQIVIRLTPLKLGPNNSPPATVSLGETVGATLTATSAVSASGVYAAPFGTATIPGAANPISGRDIVVEQAALPGRFAPGKFCSQLSGHVVQPTDIILEGSMNTCIYVPVKDGDPTPSLQTTDFASTCALD